MIYTITKILKVINTVIVYFVFFNVYFIELRANENEEPWEKYDIKPNIPLIIGEYRNAPRFSSAIDGFLINLYKTKISTNSIDGRCPFHISCSSFTLKKITENGLIFGTVISIDRLFFRENPMSFKIYPFIKNNRIYKLDDSFFID